MPRGEFLARYSPLSMHVIRRHDADHDRTTECLNHVCGALSDDGFRRVLSFRPDGPARFKTRLIADVANFCVDWRRKERGRVRPLQCVARGSIGRLAIVLRRRIREVQAMASITKTARQFFDACESGKGWAICRQWCAPDATFAAQAEPLADVRTLEQYADWMKGLLKFMPDGRYELHCFAVDDQRHAVSAYAVFKGTHTGEGGPCPPTGRQVASDYVYVMFFEDDRIRHMQKIWHSGLAMKELGWI